MCFLSKCCSLSIHLCRVEVWILLTQKIISAPNLLKHKRLYFEALDKRKVRKQKCEEWSLKAFPVLSEHLTQRIIKFRGKDFFFLLLRNQDTEERSQPLREHTALQKTLDQFSNTHVRWLTTVCNSGSDTIGLPGQLHVCAHIYIHMHMFLKN